MMSDHGMISHVLLKNPGLGDGSVRGMTDVGGLRSEGIDFVVTRNIGWKDFGKLGNNVANKRGPAVTGVQAAKKTKQSG